MLRLMLADDEQYEREYLEKTIKECYPSLLEICYKAADGQELLEHLTEHNPQIVLLDIKMPRMDGFEAAKEIRKICPDAHIIIVSAYSDFTYAKQAMQIGISEYLLKPYMDTELRAVLDRVIARIREREDALSMLSSAKAEETLPEMELLKEMEKDYIWNLFFGRRDLKEAHKIAAMNGVENNWIKVVLISSSALASMGDFSQEVLKNYFQMEGVDVWISIWMNQMAVCLFAKEQDVFMEVNGCIRRARNYLVEEHQIPVACGMSGTYQGFELLQTAYEEAASYIVEFSEADVKEEFLNTAAKMKKMCELEDSIMNSVVNNEPEVVQDEMEEMIDILEEALDYEDVAVKLNFSRSMLTILHGINRIPGIRVKTAEMIRHVEYMEQLNFTGDHLRYHLDSFADIRTEKE